MAQISHTDIGSLWLLHWPKADGGPVPGPELQARLSEAGLLLDTCLRVLALGLAPRPGGDLEGGELRIGAPAYAFALEVTAGLRSAVPGETNVFGQFRQAGRASAGRRHADPLRRLIDCLVEDTREIRTAHLQGIGGKSYGSLVRRLLRARPGERILIVGSGALAQSLLPFLGAFRVGLWSRRPAARESGPVARVERRFRPEEATLAGRWADHVVLTTPADDVHDHGWAERLATSAVRSVVHLGRRRAQPLCWQPSLRSFDLDDVFALAGEQAAARAGQLAKARLACALHAAARSRMQAGRRAGLFAPVLDSPC